jgi:hypothetical protein
MSIPRIAPLRPYFFATGIVLLGIGGKVAFAGLGVGAINITPWEIVPLLVAGVMLIMLGWPRKAGPDGILDDEIGESTITEDEP